MPARPLASATISFGLVAIPVKLFTSSESAEHISFRQLHATCKTPLKRPYYCPKDEVMVDYDDIVKGYEYSKGQYVLFTEEELESLEQEVTKTIEIEEFLPVEKVDPVYLDRTYYLAPDKGGARSYQLLSKALAKKELGGLAKYAARGKQYLVCVRAMEEGLVMQQLHYPDEVRKFSEIPIEEANVKEAELKLAFQLIEQSITKEFRPEKYTDDVKARVQEVIQKKVEGEEITFAAAEEPKAQIIDLMEALKASLEPGA
ncbi:MAG TPA: Ku protein, partial [Candidatus Eisenbacteria bacterium]|nr:Ku protein [Candidatus Eisenbacteria bacterium]